MSYKSRLGSLKLAATVCLLGLAVAAYPATISLSARQNCDGFFSTGHWLYYCYFSGTVTFSGTPNLSAVDCYIGGTFSGTQLSGFTNVGTNQLGYARCCNVAARMAGSGPYQTEDVATDTNNTVVASGYADWSP